MAIAESRLLILVDQLEEIFTIKGISRSEQENFVTALQALATSGLVWIVANMRSDFFDRLETLPSLIQLSSGEARYVLAAPTTSEIGQVIRQPAREAGLTFEFDAEKGVGLDEVVREAAAKDAGALPLLSFLMDQLWQRRSEKGLLTFAAYRALGGLEGALGLRAEQIYAAQSPDVQAALPNVLRALVTIGEGANATASGRSVKLAMFAEGTPARALVDAFLDPTARLLVADTAFEAAPTAGLADQGFGSPLAAPDGAAAPHKECRPTRGALLRIAHEALLSHWPRAKEQIDLDRRDLALLARLDNAATRWRVADRRDRDGLVLPTGLLLSEALDLQRRWPSEIPADVRQFITESRRVARRRLQRTIAVMAAAVLALPIAAGVVWAAMIWHGVRAVEGTLAFVPVPAGCFMMGSPPDEKGRIGLQAGDFDHEAQHRVCVKTFGLTKFDITQEQWREVMVENPDPSRFKGGDRPVEMVSWNDARSFIWRMNTFGQHSYRLPTEAEWEYATRAGTTTAWFWGDKIENGCPYADLRDETYKSKHWDVDEAIIGCADGFDETAPVGSFRPNGFGLYDMVGNVFQWTEDCGGDYTKAPNDGSAAEAANCKWRVVRGGSWTSRPPYTRSASRDIYAPVNRNDIVGFRLAR